MTDKSDPKWAAGEALEGVVTVGDPKLRREAIQVDEPDKVRTLCDQMVARLRALKGAGIAANQVGESVAVIVVEVRKTDFFPDRPESPLYVMINPVIRERSSEKDEDWEGCFSVPGLMGQVPRARSIRLSYTLPSGELRDEWFDGYLARVIQHECDHLDGNIFLDRMETMASVTTVDNFAKYHRL